MCEDQKTPTIPYTACGALRGDQLCRYEPHQTGQHSWEAEPEQQRVYVVREQQMFNSYLLGIFAEETDALREANTSIMRTCIPMPVIPKGGRLPEIKRD